MNKNELELVRTIVKGRYSSGLLCRFRQIILTLSHQNRLHKFHVAYERTSKLKSLATSLPKIVGLGIAIASIGFFGQIASAQSLQAVSWQSASNINPNGGGTPLHFFDFSLTNNGSVVSSAYSGSFTGLDGSGHSQTMTFNGNSHSNAEYGRLHDYATATLNNPYYNTSNSAYVDNNGDVANPNGSPNNLTSLSSSQFTDTLQYGGVLQAGYRARFIYHLHGFNTGSIGNGQGVFDVLGVDIDGTQLDITAINSPLPTPEFGFDWGTKEIALNGTHKQTIKTQLDADVNYDLGTLTQGQNYSGTTDLSATITLSAIELVDANGNLASGWTVTSGSGTVYNTIQGRTSAVPEPGSIALLVCGCASGGLMFLRRRIKRA